MRNTLAIARKELNVYFTTPVAYVAFCAFTVIASYFFVNIVQQFMQYSLISMQMPQAVDPARLNLTDMVMAPFIGNIGVIFLLVIPLIAMRLLAEEKQQHTFELLMTAPVRPTEIVLGKFLGGLTVVALTVGFTLLYPLVLQAYGASAGQSSPVEWSTVLGAYLGLFCWGAAALAIGLFLSSLTESQVVAAVATFVVLLLLWVIGWASSETNEGVKLVVSNLSSLEHLRNMTRGEIGLKDLIYFGSIVIFGLYLSQRSVEGQRWA